MNNLLAIRTLERTEIESLLGSAAGHKARVLVEGTIAAPTGRSVGLIFFEKSTRTRVSFEQASSYLGHRSVNFSGEASSMGKGETLKDTILTLRYERLDGLVMRHPSSGACHLAAEYFGGPVVNAGDGRHEHPTQALGDALTIVERKGALSGLRVVIVGDVRNSRVARSNAWLLTKMGAEVRFCGPRSLVPTQPSQLPGTIIPDLREAVDGADVVMCLRIQRERMAEGLFGSAAEYTRRYQVTRSLLRHAAKDVIVMHPGPMNRGVELDDATADGPASAISDQVTNCLFVRMAVLDRMFATAQHSGQTVAGA